MAGWEILLRVVNTSVQLLRLENAARPSSSPTEVNGADGDGGSEAGAVLDEVGNNKARDAKDRERWVKLKKLRQVFHVERGKERRVAKENFFKISNQFIARHQSCSKTAQLLFEL